MQATAWQVTIINMLVAVLAGIMIFPAVFSFGITPFRWCGTRVYHVTERIWAIPLSGFVPLYFLYLASDGGTDFYDLFT